MAYTYFRPRMWVRAKKRLMNPPTISPGAGDPLTAVVRSAESAPGVPLRPDNSAAEKQQMQYRAERAVSHILAISNVRAHYPEMRAALRYIATAANDCLDATESRIREMEDRTFSDTAAKPQPEIKASEMAQGGGLVELNQDTAHVAHHAHSESQQMNKDIAAWIIVAVIIVLGAIAVGCVIGLTKEFLRENSQPRTSVNETK